MPQSREFRPLHRIYAGADGPPSRRNLYNRGRRGDRLRICEEAPLRHGIRRALYRLRNNAEAEPKIQRDLPQTLYEPSHRPRHGEDDCAGQADEQESEVRQEVD